VIEAPKLEPVPTVKELVRNQLAEPIAQSHYRISPEGQQIVYDVMARNAAKLREYNEQRAALKRAVRRRAQAAAVDWAADAFAE